MQVARSGLRAVSGARLRNTWEPARLWGITRERGANPAYARASEESRKALAEGPAAHQVVGGVMAYQADDG